MTSTTPQHEPEVLAAHNRRAVAEKGLPEGWLTDDQATALLVSAVVDRAVGHAERAYLGSIGMAPECSDRAIASCSAEVFAEVHRAAAFLDLAPAARAQLAIDVARRFDARMAFLRASPLLSLGSA